MVKGKKGTLAPIEARRAEPAKERRPVAAGLRDCPLTPCPEGWTLQIKVSGTQFPIVSFFEKSEKELYD